MGFRNKSTLDNVGNHNFISTGPYVRVNSVHRKRSDRREKGEICAVKKSVPSSYLLPSCILHTLY
jgi:hypothetical protein